MWKKWAYMGASESCIGLLNPYGCWEHKEERELTLALRMPLKIA